MNNQTVVLIAIEKNYKQEKKKKIVEVLKSIIAVIWKRRNKI